jgi:hypothetical protein
MIGGLFCDIFHLKSDKICDLNSAVGETAINVFGYNYCWPSIMQLRRREVEALTAQVVGDELVRYE